MAWSRIDPVDGKPRYIQRYGGIVVLSKDKDGALDDIPEGWEVTQHPSGHLKLRKKK